MMCDNVRGTIDGDKREWPPPPIQVIAMGKRKKGGPEGSPFF